MSINYYKLMSDALRRDYISNDFYVYLDDIKYFEAPASLNHHGCHKGGLAEHSYNVYECLKESPRRFRLERSPFIIGMFHDLCKTDDYVYDQEEDKWKWNDSQVIKGHGDKSIMMLSQFMTLTEEEILCIRYHMGPYMTDEWDEYDKAIRKCPNVLFTHTADMYASKVLENKELS